MGGHIVGPAFFQSAENPPLQAGGVVAAGENKVGVPGGPVKLLLGHMVPIDREQHLPVQHGDFSLYALVFGEHILGVHLAGQLAGLPAQNDSVQGGLNLPVKGGGVLPGLRLQQSLRPGVYIGVRGGVQGIVAQKAQHIGPVGPVWAAGQKLPHGPQGGGGGSPVQGGAVLFQRFHVLFGRGLDVPVAEEKIGPLGPPEKSALVHGL